MRAKLLSHLRPTPATVVALLAFVFATSGVAAAKPAGVDKDEVTLVTLTGGPVVTTTPFEHVAIPLNGNPTFTFTQRAGEAIQLITEADMDPGASDFCDVTVIVYDTVSNMGTRMEAFTNKGEFGEATTAVDGLPVSTSDRTVTLAAFARETDPCDEDIPDEDDNLADAWTVSVTVTIVTLRN